MTLTNEQKNIIESLMPIIAKKVNEGMNGIDALRFAMNYYNEFACEMMDNTSKRSKIYSEYGAAKCYQYFKNK